jgi:hypothetical protein
VSIVVPNPPEGPSGYIGSGDEIDIQRRITVEYINNKPSVITLVPRARAKQPTGGFAFQELSPGYGTLPIMLTGSDGVEREMELMMLGRWDCDLEKYDIFEYSGQRYEVAQLYFFNGWEQRAEVIKFG